MTDLEQQYSAYQREVCEWCAQGSSVLGEDRWVHKIYPMNSSAPDHQKSPKIIGKFSEYLRCTALPILEWADQRDKAKDQRIADLVDNGRRVCTALQRFDALGFGTPEDGIVHLGESLKAKGEEIERATRYAKTLTVALAKKYPAVEGWQPLEDLFGLLMQIDNMTVGFTERNASQAREIGELRKGASALADALETCHICAGSLCLDDIGPAHCENCSWDCDEHEEPNCTPIYVLHRNLRALLSRTGEPQVDAGSVTGAVDSGEVLRKDLADNLTTNQDQSR